MTEQQAIQASGATGYVVIRFCKDRYVCAIPAKMVLEPPATLSSGDDCVIRWSDGCCPEAEVLRTVSDYATAKRIEKELIKELDAGEESEGTDEPPAKKAKGTDKPPDHGHCSHPLAQSHAAVLGVSC